MVTTIPFFKECQSAGAHLVALTGSHTLGHAHGAQNLRRVRGGHPAEHGKRAEHGRDARDVRQRVLETRDPRGVSEIPRARGEVRLVHGAVTFTDAFANETWLPAPVHEAGVLKAPFAFRNTVDTLWLDRDGNTCGDRVPVRERHEQQREYLQRERRGGQCVSPEASTKCTRPLRRPLPGAGARR